MSRNSGSTPGWLNEAVAASLAKDGLGGGPQLPARYRALPRRRKRALVRRIEHALSGEVADRSGKTLSRRQRRSVVTALAALVLGALVPTAGRAVVQVVDDVDFIVEIDAGEGVLIECNGQGTVRVIVDGDGTDYGTACSDVNLLNVLADANSVGNLIDLSAVKPAEFSDPAILIDGGGGADTLFGSFFGDTLLGGDGADTIWGAEGGDTLFGGPQGDTLRPGPGSDTVFDGSGADLVEVPFGS